MKVFFVLFVFGKQVLVVNTPYTLDECLETIKVVGHVEELQSYPACVETRGDWVPMQEELTPAEQKQVDDWVEERQKTKV